MATVRRITIGFITTLALGLLATPLPADAQQAGKVHFIGLLETGSISRRAHLWEALRKQLRELGYLEGHNIALESRGADGKYERLPDLAAELVRLKVSVIVTAGTRAAQAAKKATTTIPIVMATCADPVGVGLVASLPRPGGNITGVAMRSTEISGKRLELLKEVVPGLSRVAVLHNPGAGISERALKEMQVAAQALGVQLQILEVARPEDLDSAFLAMARDRPDALVVISTPMLYSARRRIVALAAKHRLPAIHHWEAYVDAGGLMAYGPDLAEGFRLAAIYVDKILHGTKPADLPMVQPRKFDLVINLKTAKALGLTISPMLLYQATKVIR
jgi:putative ABC transport system substrate-binding protein